MLTAARIRRTDTTLPQSYRVVFAAEFYQDVDQNPTERVFIELAALKNDVAGATTQYYMRKQFGAIQRVKVDEWRIYAQACVALQS